MRHGVDHRRLSRSTPHRKAMLSNQVVSLISHERIQTTVAKAKELRRVADRMVTLGKKGTLASRRQAAKWVGDATALRKLFGELSSRFEKRPGGYTRILRSGFRAGDQAPMVFIEYLPGETTKTGKPEKKKPTASKTKKATKKTAKK